MPHLKRRPIRLLVQRADKLGDVVLSLPVIEQLKRAYPKSEIHYLTSPLGAELAEAHPFIDQVLTVPSFKLKRLREFRDLVRRIQFNEYDVYISLWNNPWMAWLGKLAKIPVRIGDSSNPSLAHCYTHPVLQDWQDFTRHQIEFNLDLLRPISTTIFDPIRRIAVDESVLKQVQSDLDIQIDSTKKRVVIFIGTGGTNYPIPVDPLMGFIQKLGDIQHYTILLCGQVSDDHPLRSFNRSYVINKLNETTLMELAAIIHECDYFVGSDTGPTHIASFLNKPILFFSPIKPNPPLRWGPWSDHFVILRREYTCRRFCSATNCSSTCFSYVKDSLLMDMFNQLVYQVSVEGPMTAAQKKRQHLLHSVRVLYVAKSDIEHRLLSPVIKRLQDQGLVITMQSSLSVFHLIRHIIQGNINVLQGDISWWKRAAVRFYIGVIKQYIVPIYVSYPIRDFVTLTDYMSIYHSNWTFRTK